MPPASKSSSLVGFLFNAQGCANKLRELYQFLTAQDPDFICVCETWLTSDIPDSSFCPPNYVAFRCDRESVFPGVMRGGCAIIAKSQLAPTQLRTAVSAEIVCVQLHIQGERRPTSIACVYRSCNQDHVTTFGVSDLFLVQEVGRALGTCANHDVIVCGDFNLPHLTWPDAIPHSAIERAFLEIATDHLLTQHVQFATRGHHTLELVLSNCTERITSCCPHPGFSSSDHDTSVKFEVETNYR